MWIVKSFSDAHPPGQSKRRQYQPAEPKEIAPGDPVALSQSAPLVQDSDLKDNRSGGHRQGTSSPGGLAAPQRGLSLNPRNLRLLVTTKIELKDIAPAASMGFN